jgi:glutamate/aspartate transport system substrate-binding protein
MESIMFMARSYLAFILVLAGPCAHAAGTLTKIAETQVITIAHREASVPFSYLDENSKPIGYSVDLCLTIADAVKRQLKLPQLEIKYLPVTSSNRIPAIAEEKADLECGSTTNNAERRKQVAFTIPHFVAAVRMVVKADSGIRNWVDLRDKRVVTTKGTTTVKLLTERDKVRSLRLKLIEGRDHVDSFDMVATGQAEAFTMDDVLLYGLRAGAKEPDAFVVTGDPLWFEAYAIMLRKDDPQFKALIDAEMARIIYNGDIFKLYAKWFKSPIPPKGINMAMPMSHILRDSLRFPTDKVND